jgi:hypothetical protein
VLGGQRLLPLESSLVAPWESAQHFLGYRQPVRALLVNNSSVLRSCRKLPSNLNRSRPLILTYTGLYE